MWEHGPWPSLPLWQRVLSVPPGIGLKHLANLMKMLHTLLVFRGDPQPHFNSRTGALQLRSVADTDAARREITKGGSCSTRKFDEGSLREWLIRLF